MVVQLQSIHQAVPLIYSQSHTLYMYHNSYKILATKNTYHTMFMWQGFMNHSITDALLLQSMHSVSPGEQYVVPNKAII